MNPPKFILLDCDPLIYSIGFCYQEPNDLGLACHTLDKKIEGIKKKLGIDKLKGYLTGKGNFRDKLVDDYKANRKDFTKPVFYKELREHLVNKWKAVVVDGMEADDALAILQHKHGDKTVIVSIDKDLRTVGGWHYTYSVGERPEKPLEYITHDGYVKLLEKPSGNRVRKYIVGGGMMFFYYQCLVGDSTDNIAGLPRYGDVKAWNILKECNSTEEAFNAVKEHYKAVFDSEWKEKLLTAGRLLWMTRERKDGECVMWELPYEEC